MTITETDVPTVPVPRAHESVSYAVRVHGAIDAARLDAALTDVAGRPVWTQRLTADSVAAAVRRVAAHDVRPWRPATAPPLRAYLVRIAQDEHVLVLTAPGTTEDEHSMASLWRDLVARYDGHADTTADAPGTTEALVNAAVHRAVGDLARRTGTSEHTVLLAAFLATRYRHDRQDEQVVGLPEPGGVAALSVTVEPDLRFADLIGRIAAARPSPGSTPSALFSVGGQPECFAGTSVEEVGVHTGMAGADLALRLTPAGGRLRGCLRYTDALDSLAAGAWLDAFRTLLADAVRRPTVRVGELVMLPAARRALQSARINTGFQTYPGLRPIHAGFEAVAAGSPQAIAVESAAGSATYGELDGRAATLAGQLLAEGVRPEAPVGVLVERSAELVVALVGTLKAGAAFVPLDAKLPPARIATIARDAGMTVVVTQTALADRLRDVPVTPVFVPDREARPRPVLPAVSVDQAAYVYYTSGSTGTPKGVVIDHRCAAGRLAWLGARYGLRPGDRLVHKTPLIFDVAVWELFGPLAAGATVLLADPGAESDVAHLSELLARPGTVFSHFVPSMLDAYLSHAPARDYPDLRWVQVSGEASTTRLLDRFAGHFAAEFHNLYGQTETSEVAAWEGRSAPDGATVPMGRQIGIYRLFVVDEALRLVPPGVPGELCVAGLGGLARGYHGRPELTAERFVPNPYAIVPGERLYRTGDLAGMTADGTLTYLGRVDEQVKIRGCRVETGEVEAVLATHPAVRSCAVVARPDDDGADQLVAYVTGTGVDVAELAAHCEARLPAYMLPAVYVELDSLPLGPTGKLDRRALPAPTAADRGSRTGGDQPESELERELALLWRDVLGVAAIGRTDNFFAVGGNSLKSLQVLNRVHAVFGVQVTVRQFFAEPTIERMASTVERSLLDMVTAMSDGEAAARLRELEG